MGILYSLQNLTSIDVRFWRLKSIPDGIDGLPVVSATFNLFTTIHDGNFRRHSSMNVTIKWHKFSSNIYYIYVFFVIWSWKLRQQFQLQMTKNRTPTPVYLDPGMHPGLEVKGLSIDQLSLVSECNAFRSTLLVSECECICVYRSLPFSDSMYILGTPVGL